MHGLTDYLSPETEESVLTEENLTAFRDKYDISNAFEMLVSSRKGRVSEPPKGCIAFYDKSLQSGL